MKIGLCGLGRAGQTMAKKILDSDKHELSCVICREISETAGMDVSQIMGIFPIGLKVIKLSEFALLDQSKLPDIVIDFSNHSMSLELMRVCENLGINLVICTTGFTDEGRTEMIETGLRKKIGLVYAPTLTLGINLLIEVVSKLSAMLPWFDFAIVERHRKDKKRVTTTAQLIADATKRDDIHISSVRAGGYVGIHEVTAASENERLTITHESFNRGAFADGAMMAAEFINGRKGYYEMKNVIDDFVQRLKDNEDC